MKDDKNPLPLNVFQFRVIYSINFKGKPSSSEIAESAYLIWRATEAGPWLDGVSLKHLSHPLRVSLANRNMCEETVEAQ